MASSKPKSTSTVDAGGNNTSTNSSANANANANANIKSNTSNPNFSAKRTASVPRLTEYASLRDLTLTPPARLSREASPSPYQQLRQNPRIASAKASRESSPARTVSSTTSSRVASATNSANQSTANVHQVESTIQPISPRPHRPLPSVMPQWPQNQQNVSPRHSFSTRSPPPNKPQSPVGSPRRKTEPNQPSIVLVLDQESLKRRSPEEELAAYSGLRTPRHSQSPVPILETVAENSAPTTPNIGVERNLDQPAPPSSTGTSTPTPTPQPKEPETQAKANETDSDSGNKSDDKPPSRAPSRLARRPTLGNTSKAPQNEATRNMTAEIETVASIPQPVNPPPGGKLSKKLSSDTIRPPKEKKKKVKRTSNIVPTNRKSSSHLNFVPILIEAEAKKSDLFEQKINDTLEDADSSDSEETFVYESNPPEPPSRPRHSRTPSTSSIHNEVRRTMADPNQNLSSKRSWKFGPSHRDAGAYSDAYNTESSAVLSAREGHSAGTSSHQASLRGHSGGHRNHQSVFSDDGGPFATHSNQLHKPSHTSVRHGHHVSSSRASSRPPSPRAGGMRHASAGNGGYFGQKRGSKLSLYEGDIETEATDTTPLLNYGTRIGQPPARHSKRRHAGHDWRERERRNNCATRMVACLIAAVVVLFVIAGALGFLFVTTKPLEEVSVKNITDVIVSKQELMLNLSVGAINANALAITVATMDVNIFAKSPYVKDKKPGDGDDDDDDGWWFIGKQRIKISPQSKRPARQTSTHADDHFITTTTHPHLNSGVDEGVGTDPDDDLEKDSQTMLLGRVFVFDSPLVFDGSPFRRQASESIGEMRLPKPGNKTEEGGSERWERIMVHKFELIVRGVLRYQLPLSGRVRTTPISASIMVHPDEEPAERKRIGSTRPV